MVKFEDKLYNKLKNIKPDYLLAHLDIEDFPGFKQTLKPGYALDYPTDLDVRYLSLTIPSAHLNTARNSFIKVAKELGVKGLFITQSNIILPKDVLYNIFNFSSLNDGACICLNTTMPNSSKTAFFNNKDGKLNTDILENKGLIYCNWYNSFESFYIPITDKIKSTKDTDFFKVLIEDGNPLCSYEIYFLHKLNSLGIATFIAKDIKALKINKDFSLSYPLATNLSRFRFL